MSAAAPLSSPLNRPVYAIGVGSKSTDLSLIYENDANFAAFPTYPVVLNFKGDSSTVVDFFAYATKMSGNVPGLPEMDPGRILRGCSLQR